MAGDVDAGVNVGKRNFCEGGETIMRIKKNREREESGKKIV